LGTEISCSESRTPGMQWSGEESAAEMPRAGQGADSPSRCQLPPLGAGEGKHPKARAGAPSHAAAAGSAGQCPAPDAGRREVRLGWRAQSCPLAWQPAPPEATRLSARGDGGETKGSKSLTCCGCAVKTPCWKSPGTSACL